MREVYNLKREELDENLDKNHFYMNDIMHCMNSNARKVTSYKYVFFKCILDNLFNATKTGKYYYLDFYFLRYSFSKIYWNLAAKHNVPQIHNGRISVMEEKYKVIASDSKNHAEHVDFDVLNAQVREKYLKATANQIELNVMHALYDDFNRHIYGYDKEKGFIYFSEGSYSFLSNFKDALEKIDFYAWIKWTENILEIGHKKIDNLSRKLDEEPERVALDRFKDELLSKGDELRCFYCGKSLSGEKIHLDHFIPWSFVKDNQMWNFVFSCPSCNENKSDKIPNEEMLKKICDRNKTLLGNSYKENLTKLRESALHNGFEMWNIKTSK